MQSIGKKLLSLAVALLFFSGTVRADSAAGSDTAWETYIRSQKEIQVAFHHLVRLYLHDLKETIEMSRDLELAKADQKSERFYFLVKYAPERIVRNQGFRAFVNFPWVPADEDALRKESKTFRKREKKITEWQSRLDASPDFKKVLQKLQELQPTPEYNRIQIRFRSVPKDVESLLGGAPPGQVTA